MLATAKTVFVISLLTSRMIMPGMPKMPAGMGIPDMTAPQKTMTMDLTSNKKVDAKSWAQCAVPEGLKLGPKVDLQIDLPVKSTPGPHEGPAEGSAEMPKFVMKMYWKCSDTVLPGQPKVIDSEKMMKDMPKPGTMGGMGKMRPGMKPPMMRSTGSDESHAYWPNGKDNKKIVPESSSPGDYKLTTNYCGGTSITFGPQQEFLEAIDLTSPGKSPDLAKTIKIEWKPVKNALAYVIMAMAGKQGESVMWTSSSQPEMTVNYTSEALTKAQVDSYIEKGIFLPPTATECYIPAGIFKNVGTPMLTMTAIGADKIQTKDGIKTDVIVRSTAMMMLGGMGGMAPGMGEDAAVNQPEENAQDAAVSTDEGAKTAPAAPKTPAQKAKDALGKLGGIFKH